MTRNFEALATDLFNAGFSSKAGQKAALDYVTRAYEEAKRVLSDACLAARFPSTVVQDGETHEILAMTPAAKAVYWDIPSYPHQFKAKHAELVRDAFGDRFDATLADMARFVELRDAIKAAPITPPAKDETKVRAARVVESIKALMARRNAQYLTAIDLSEVVGDGVVIKGLTANSHYVTNEHGTTFIRTFYYLNGSLTPLNSILAGCEETARRGGLAA